MVSGADETLELLLCGEEAVIDESYFQPVPHGGGPLKIISPSARCRCVSADSQQPSAFPSLDCALPFLDL